jgi:hypothetical protein
MGGREHGREKFRTSARLISKKVGRACASLFPGLLITGAGTAPVLRLYKQRHSELCSELANGQTPKVVWLFSTAHCAAAGLQ